MTREEAIKSLQNIIEYWTYKPTEVEAAKMAIAALRPVSREKVEKMRGVWIPVRESEITGWDPALAGYDPIGGYVCSQCKTGATLDCNDEFALDNFCPACGAPMTDEAVQMVMERMEALNDETD